MRLYRALTSKLACATYFALGAAVCLLAPGPYMTALGVVAGGLALTVYLLPAECWRRWGGE